MKTDACALAVVLLHCNQTLCDIPRKRGTSVLQGSAVCMTHCCSMLCL